METSFFKNKTTLLINLHYFVEHEKIQVKNFKSLKVILEYNMVGGISIASF